MVGREGLRFLVVALAASAFGSSALAQTRAPDSDLAGLVFPTQPRDWGSDPGGFKAASLDLAAALTGKACGAEEFHAWTIRDFAAGVTLSEAVDESFRAAGWRLDLVSRDSELSRIYLASRGDDGLILNWLPDEGVVGLLMCAAAEPGSVPERVVAAAPPRGFSLDPTMPPLPLPRPSAEAVAAATADLAATDPAAPADAPAELALAADTPSAIAAAAPVAADTPPAAATDIATAPAPAESTPTALAIAPAPAGAAPAEASEPTASPVAEPAPDAALTMTAGAPEAASPLVAGATEPPLATAAPVPASLAATPAPTAVPAPTRTPIDLGMTAAIRDEAASATPPATGTALAAAEPPRRPFSDAAAAYERVPPPSGLIDPTSVAVSTAAPAARPQPTTAAPVVPTRPVTLLAQGPAIAVEPAGLQALPIPVTTILAPVFEPGGMPVWPYFLLAVVLAGAGLAIILRRATPPVPPAHAEWPTALASVVGANLDERVGEAGIEFTPVLRYRFSVGENEFEAVTEGWGGRALPTRSAAEAVIASFPDHARVEISYDPTDPTRIALPEAARPADPMLMVAAACLLLAALTLALTLV